jgi:drug/metabolite transporter (DMT)-like permease
VTGRDWARLLVLAAVWSGSFLCAEIALRDFGPLTIAAGRVALGAAFLGGWMRLRGTAFPVERWPAFLAMGLLNNAVPFSLVFWAQQSIDSGLAAILNATTPLFAALLAAGSGLERLTPLRLVGLALGMAGVAALIGPEAWHGADQALAAEAAVLLATFFYAVAGLFGKRALGGMAPDAAACGMLLASSVLLLPAALLIEAPWRASPHAAGILAVLAFGLFGAALAYGLYFRILASAGATNLLLVTFLLPVGALVLGVLFLGEQVGANEVAGLALILSGLILIDCRALGPLTATSRRGAATSGLPRRSRPS